VNAGPAPRDLLSGHALRATRTRIRILEAMWGAPIPLSAGEVHARLGPKGPDLVTVYRTLERFVRAGLLREVRLDDGVRRYEPAARGHHHHLVCTSCGEMRDIETCVLEPVESRVLQEHGFRVSRHSLEFFGTCERCHRE
jgi:Fur family ferric uptake transcriptional regulator